MAQETQDESNLPLDKPQTPVKSIHNDGMNPNSNTDSNSNLHTSTDKDEDAQLEEAGESQDTENNDDDDDDDDDHEEEPKLKYHRLTDNLSATYRGGDATSCFIVSGDKMIMGTHNGSISVIAMPSFQPLRLYHAHSATVTSVSVSPFPIPFSNPVHEPSKLQHELKSPSLSSPAPSISGASLKSPKKSSTPSIVPPTPSNSIYIATSSMDGNVCVASLIDQKDVMLRNFARPVSAVALSPNYKNDRQYLSGGLAGNLILTIGGKPGVGSNANTNSAAAAASGWLSAIGLGSNTGRDSIIHSGEGSISAIKWSLSGKFVVWVNEKGIKVMRSNLHLDNNDVDYAWNRIAHIDRPTRSQWDDMAGVWKARVEWLEDSNLESDDNQPLTTKTSTKKKSEKLVVGWGDSVWILQVKSETKSSGKDGPKRANGSASILHHLLFDDCIISGASLYTPSLLLILAYRTRDDDDQPLPTKLQTTPRRGVHHRQSGLSPEMRLIDINTKEEVDADTLTMSRYETLSAADYHLGTLYIPPIKAILPSSRGAFETLTGIWDASLSAGLNAGISATRIFNPSVSIRSGSANGNGHGSMDASPSLRAISVSQGLPNLKPPSEILPVARIPGLKIFIQSPYDCVLSIKRDLGDHLNWLIDHKRYKEAFQLAQENPETLSVSNNDDISTLDDDVQSTPTKYNKQSLGDFFADDTASQSTVSASKFKREAVDNERRRIGELWLQQLIDDDKWVSAGQITQKVLGISFRWEYWIKKFSDAGHYDEITPHIPIKQLHPPLSRTVYDLVLKHYLDTNCLRFQELMNAWDTYLFNVDVIIHNIHTKLERDEIRSDSVQGGIKGRDWRILLEALAKLHLSIGQPKDALKYYIQLQNSDDAMALISEYHLLDSVSDDIPGFITLRVSKDQLSSGSSNDLEEASSDAIRLLADESLTGLIQPKMVIDQLTAKGDTFKPFLFYYLRILWKGHSSEIRPRGIHHQRLESEGRQYVAEYGDLSAGLFAQYDRDLFMEFLKASRSYSYEKATILCEEKQYFPELVYIFSQTGQTKRALNLIINSLGDVKFAIDFVKGQNDIELWDDLVEFSMDKPRFIIGLLEEAGSSIDAIKLVKRIPEGLEVPGLRDSIGLMLRENEIQSSISEGVAKVLRGEVATGMDILRKGRAKAIKFVQADSEKSALETDIETTVTKDTTESTEITKAKETTETKTAKADIEYDSQVKSKDSISKPGVCVSCHKSFNALDNDTLIGFACGHVYHMSCIIKTIEDGAIKETAERLQKQLSQNAYTQDDDDGGRSVRAKVTHVQIIRSFVGKGCPTCRRLIDD